MIALPVVSLFLLLGARAPGDTSAARDSTTRSPEGPGRTAPSWWEARVTLEAEGFGTASGGPSAWQRHTIAMGRRTERLSFSIEGFASRRFDTWDRGVGGDVTTVLWPGAYASVRAQAAPSAATIARTDLGAELTQALPHALEVAPSWRIMRFRDASVAIYGVGLARYAGDWYLRGRMTAAPQSDRTGTAGTLLARRYFGSASDLLEMHVGTGQEVIVLPPPAAAALRRTAFVALRGARTLTPVLVGTVGASLDRDEGLGIRRGVRLGTEVRW